jgi:glutathione S-transferase
MYQLYYLKDACSLATHVVLLELGQEISIINKQDCEDFASLNPTGAVPVLVHDTQVMTEGAAIMLHILNTHKSPLFPEEKHARLQAVQDIMFANATMHPAYSKLFFIAQHITDPAAKLMALNAASNKINQLWAVVEQQLADKPFLGGDAPSAADIMLSVYSRWSGSFPIDILYGERTRNMLSAVQAMPSFQTAIKAQAA